MKLTKKQRIALEFLAEVGPAHGHTIKVRRVLFALQKKDLAVYYAMEYRITKQGREALKEAQAR